MTFLRDSFEGLATSLPRRRINDETPFVGGMYPIAPGGLSTGTNVAASVFAGIQDFQSGNYLGAIGRTLQVGVLGAEAIESGANAIGGAILDFRNWASRKLGGKGIPGHRGSSPVGNVYTNKKPVLFQYFPENIQDRRTNNVEFIKPPGVSLPVPTLASASERTISFTLTFARERWPGRQVRPATDQWDKYNFDVAASLQAIRMYTYPIGTNVLGLVKAGITPQPFILTLPGTRIGIDGDSIAAILVDYSIDYVAHFPDGQPRLARIGLTISEILGGLTQNVTGGSFENVMNSAFLGATSAIQPRSVSDQDATKGTYGITIKNDVSLVKTIPPQ